MKTSDIAARRGDDYYEHGYLVCPDHGLADVYIPDGMEASEDELAADLERSRVKDQYSMPSD
jgi:hypothetical protein